MEVGNILNSNALNGEKDYKQIIIIFQVLENEKEWTR